MFSVGETLKRARVAQGLDLETVAARTRINIKYLEAIEADDRKQLPSGFFYKSFVDQYAGCLALDTREIDAAIDRALSAEAPLPLPGYESVVSRSVSPLKTTYRFPQRRTLASAAALLVVLVGCSGTYALWRHWKATQHAAFSQRHPVMQPARQEAVRRAAVAPVSHNPAVTAKAVPEAAPPANYKVWLDVLAHEATWLSVSSDGKPVFSGILQVNQSKMVGGKQFAKMRVGNAAGIEVHLNGKLLAPLGERGQVLDVIFTPDNFRIISPAKESD